MTRALIALFLIAGCSKSKPAASAPAELDVDAPAVAAVAAPTEVDIPLPVDRIGESVQVNSDLRGKMLVQLAPGVSRTMELTKYMEVLHEVLAVDGKGNATRARVTYQVVDVWQSAVGRLSSAIAGHSYLLARDGDRVRITRADGTRASEAELTEINSQEHDIGSANPQAALIASRRWKVGEIVQLNDAALAAINRGGSSNRITGLRLALRKVRDDVAYFDMVMDMHDATASGDMLMSLKGELQVNHRTGVWLEQNGTGPAQGNQGGNPMRGRMTLRIYIP